MTRLRSNSQHVRWGCLCQLEAVRVRRTVEFTGIFLSFYPRPLVQLEFVELASSFFLLSRTHMNSNQTWSQTFGYTFNRPQPSISSYRASSYFPPTATGRGILSSAFYSSWRWRDVFGTRSTHESRRDICPLTRKSACNAILDILSRSLL